MTQKEVNKIQELQEECPASESSAERMADITFKLLKKSETFSTLEDRKESQANDLSSAAKEMEDIESNIKALNINEDAPATSSAFEFTMIVKVIIIPQNNPQEKLRRDTINKIKEELQKLKEMSQEHPQPFVNVHPTVKNNSLRIDCIGADVKNFFLPLHGLTINDVKLRVILKQILTNRVRMLCSTEYVFSLKVLPFLTQLQKSYQSLNTRDWYIIESVVKNNFLNITIIMDELSANFIRESGYALNWLVPSYDQLSSSGSEYEI